MTELTSATRKKRADLMLAIERLLAPSSCVVGVVGVGSIALNTASEGSDIDVLVFMDPIDEYVVPAESIWCPWDDTFHSIFTEDRRIQNEGIQLDCKLCDLKQWQTDDTVWTEGQRAGLAHGWIAFDRDGRVAALIETRTRYDDATRIAKLDQSVNRLDQLVGGDAPAGAWRMHGSLIAFDRLNAGYDALIDLLFALNRRWRFWRDREIMHVLRLPWLPANAEKRLLLAQHAPSLNEAGYLSQASTLAGLFKDCVSYLQVEGFYGNDPTSEAFVRSTDGDPGRTWNLHEWSERRRRRRKD
jgi:hypothetical protein